MRKGLTFVLLAAAIGISSPKLVAEDQSLDLISSVDSAKVNTIVNYMYNWGIREVSGEYSLISINLKSKSISANIYKDSGENVLLQIVKNFGDPNNQLVCEYKIIKYNKFRFMPPLEGTLVVDGISHKEICNKPKDTLYNKIIGIIEV